MEADIRENRNKKGRKAIREKKERRKILEERQGI